MTSEKISARELKLLEAKARMVRDIAGTDRWVLAGNYRTVLDRLNQLGAISNEHARR